MGFAARGVHEAEQHVHGGGFARAVRTEKTEYFTGIDSEVQAFQCDLYSSPDVPRAKLDPKIFSLKYWLHNAYHCANSSAAPSKKLNHCLTARQQSPAAAMLRRAR